jgi:hypothetical protein
MFADSGSAYVSVKTWISSGYDGSTTSMDAGVTPATFSGTGARASAASLG